jgi:hypothetical protein
MLWPPSQPQLVIHKHIKCDWRIRSPASLRWCTITSTKNELHKTENLHIFTKSCTRCILAAACLTMTRWAARANEHAHAAHAPSTSPLAPCAGAGRGCRGATAGAVPPGRRSSQQRGPAPAAPAAVRWMARRRRQHCGRPGSRASPRAAAGSARCSAPGGHNDRPTKRCRPRFTSMSPAGAPHRGPAKQSIGCAAQRHDYACRSAR